LKPVIAIIGSGPAGLAAAGVLKARAAVFEAAAHFGGKLPVSGSGQCNFTHSGTPEDLLTHYGSAGRWLKPALFAYPPDMFVNTLERLGVPVLTRDDGKVFPASLNAVDVVNALLSEAGQAEFHPNSRVLAITRQDDRFVVTTDQSSEAFSGVLVTTGGAGPRPAMANGYSLLRGLGHTIVEPHAALTPIHVTPHELKTLSGISVPAELHIPGKKGCPPAGPLLITHFGFSGPLVLDHSRDFTPGLDIAFDLLPGWDASMLMNGGKAHVRVLLTRAGLPQRLVDVLMSRSGITPETSLAELSRISRERLVDSISRFPVHIARTGDFTVAMCTAGGVSRNEVNAKTMESRLVPGLFLAGEVMDVDGDTGGYNIQAAWSMGRLAGECLLKR
jgi:predicted Rossmann fold flavoprotein